ncbi:MAG: hypothetical protein ABSC37_14660 [Xanthobacteraceae bacterium]
MRRTKLASWLTAGLVHLAAASLLGLAPARAAESAAGASAAPQVGNPANDACLSCHGNAGFAAPGAGGTMRQLFVNKDLFGNSVHGERACVECHTDITEVPHKPGAGREVSCINCHDALWNAAKAANKTQENARLGVVVEQIDHYLQSIHARSNREDPSRPNAACYDCHSPHYVYPKGSPERTAWRLDIPNVCGKCHAKEREQYGTSVHGVAVLEAKNPAAAICSDCHTTHDVVDPRSDVAELSITRNCGNCHAENLKTYMGTYHGKVNTLGYAYTAKCFDCHGNHDIRKVNDPQSSVFPANRVKTCQKCHTGATVGFASFEPHGTSHDFARYPIIWIASKFVLFMVAATLVFFWSHTALWFYREYKERTQREPQRYVKTDELSEGKLKGRYYERFPVMWRVAHLTFAVSLMILALTGMSVLYAETSWASAVMHWLGGPKVEAVVHRTFAVLFLTVFIIQLVYFVAHIIRNRGTIELSGPDTLFPRAQDLWDIFAMFRWFFALGPKPVFDRWTYWQKFDFWAPFAAVLVIATCGLMLWFPNATAAVLPGWVFNVVTIFHGEGALLAVLFLFTVHFFNNHFRPEKFPLEVAMFTGSMPLEQFKREHRVEYNRLLASGELEKHLVDPPSQGASVGAIVLGLTLIGIGLLLLVLLLIGLFTAGL